MNSMKTTFTMSSSSNSSLTNLDIFNPNLSVVELKHLIGKGVDVNAKDNYGETSLMFHRRRGNMDIVKILISAGAN